MILTPKQIQRKYKTLRGKIVKVRLQIIELQKLCQHPNVEKKYRGDTGNYDPYADHYWIEWACPDCGKYWTTDQ